MKHESDGAGTEFSECVSTECLYRLAKNRNCASVWLEQARDDGNQGGFATAARTDQECRFAGPGFKIQAMKYLSACLPDAESFFDAGAAYTAKFSAFVLIGDWVSS